MIYNFPFGRFSYGRYYRYNNYFPYDNQVKNSKNISNSNTDIIKKDSEYEEKSSRYNNSSNFNEPIIEIFGIKLYLDDLIILSILFFLYKEGVQDELLFISLILLLLS